MAMALTACGSDDEILNDVQRGDRHPLQLTATVEDIQTRVTGDNKWEDGDVIGVKISNDPNNTIGQYKLNADGTVKEVIKGVEWQGTEPATVTAWYPYTEKAKRIYINNQQNGYTDYDYLRAETEGSSAAPVNLVFKHQMAKVRCRLKATYEGRDISISGATVKFNSIISIIVKNGEVSKEAQSGEITPYEDSESGVTTYTAMLPPQNITAGTQLIKITIGDKTVYYKPAQEITLEAGKSYNYNIKIADVPDYTIDSKGTYHVYTAEGLNKWAEAVKDNPAINCILEENITMPAPTETDGSNWTPVCQDYDNQYIGTFDGNGKSISGLKISSTNESPVGFISRLGEGGAVKNLTLEGANISSTNDYANTGAVAGYNYGTISYCHVSDDCSVKVESNVYLGGIAGFNAYPSGTIIACYALCSLSVRGYANVGGIFGSSAGSCTACYSCCKLLNEAPSKAGGISGNAPGTVTACYWANVSGATNKFEKSIGDGTDITAEVDGTEGKTWADAMNGMNKALTDAGYTDYEYAVNGDSETEPLILVKKQ